MRTTPRRILVCVAALALVATACSGADTKVKGSAARPRTVVHPLTGVVQTGSPSWEDRPVLAIKIGNAPSERPQAGLDKADLTYEEIVEGGSTRFMAIFSTNDAGRVGPVRSARKVDPTLLSPLNALFGYSGGAPSTIRVLAAASGFTDVGVDKASSAYHRDSNRRSPYNLYTSTTELWSGRSGSLPRPQFSFLKASQAAGTGSQEVAKDIGFSFAGTGAPIQYVYDATTGAYKRLLGDSPQMAEGSAPLEYRNVVVQYVRLSAGYSIDKAGYRTHDIATTGSGELIVFRGGKVFRGTWKRDSSSEPTTFADAQGRVIPLAQGNTMIELLPQGRPVAAS